MVKKQEHVEECIGDYLGPKIPSLLEFIENKIYMRQIMGLSHVESSTDAPRHYMHETPEDVLQEDDLKKLMEIKDELYKHIKFQSEQQAYDPVSKSLDYSKIKPVAQPLINVHYR